MQSVRVEHVSCQSTGLDDGLGRHFRRARYTCTGVDPVRCLTAGVLARKLVRTHLARLLAITHGRMARLPSMAGSDSSDGSGRLSLVQLATVLVVGWISFHLLVVSPVLPRAPSQYSKARKITRRAIWTPLWRIPGPWYAPWTNLWLKVQVIRGHRCQYIHSLHARYGWPLTQT